MNTGGVVVWDWEWIGEDYDQRIDVSATSILKPSPDDEDDADPDADDALDSLSEMTHTVTFKCMGVY